MTPREQAFDQHAAALVQHGMIKQYTRLNPSVDNLTALNLAAFNLEQAEQDVRDWQADDDWCVDD